MQRIQKEILMLDYFAKVKTDKFSFTLFSHMWLCVVVHLLHAKSNQPKITNHGDLRLKLTTLVPQIKQAYNQHLAQNFSNIIEYNN